MVTSSRSDGLHSGAAEAHRLIAGGDDALNHRRVVVTQEHFFLLLARDLDAATERVVIYSPFLRPDRVGELEPHLRAAVERGVRVTAHDLRETECPVRRRTRRGRVTQQRSLLLALPRA